VLTSIYTTHAQQRANVFWGFEEIDFLCNSEKTGITKDRTKLYVVHVE